MDPGLIPVYKPREHWKGVDLDIIDQSLSELVSDKLVLVSHRPLLTQPTILFLACSQWHCFEDSLEKGGASVKEVKKEALILMRPLKECVREDEEAEGGKKKEEEEGSRLKVKDGERGEEGRGKRRRSLKVVSFEGLGECHIIISN